MENSVITDRKRPILDFMIKPDHKALGEIIQLFSERYGFISVSSLGETILGKAIYSVNLGNEDAEKHLFYIGAHHATEWMTTLVLLKFINEYCEYYKSSEKVFGINMKKLFAERCIHVVPQLNCDGVDIHFHGAGDSILRERLESMSGGDYSRWQANARGVDLNHNYDSGFYEYKVLANTRGIVPGATRFAGEYPFSEPECGAVANYLRFNEKIKLLITLHTGGERIYYTSDGECPQGSYPILRHMELMTGYKRDIPKGLASYGGLTDWYISGTGNPSFTVECGKGENPLPMSDFHKIYSRVRGMFFTVPFMI